MEPYAHLKTAQELREEGNREFKGGYYDAAAAKYRAALRKDNNWALLHCNLALCFAKQEKWEECVQAATACLAAPSCDAATARKALLHRSRAYRASPHRRAAAHRDRISCGSAPTPPSARCSSSRRTRSSNLRSWRRRRSCRSVAASPLVSRAVGATALRPRGGRTVPRPKYCPRSFRGRKHKEFFCRK